MSIRSVALCAALLATCAVPVVAKPAARGPYAAALADPARPAAERSRDAARMPAQLLAFAQIAKGENHRE